MEDPKDNPDADEVLIDRQKMADKLAAETVEEFSSNIGQAGPTTITPEMLADMDPAQLQELIRMMNQAKGTQRHGSYYTKKQTTSDERKAKRKNARAARRINRTAGRGR